MEGATEPYTVHAVAFPLLAKGHILPFMRLCNLLSSRGLNIVLLTTPANAKHLRTQENNVTVVMDIPFPPVPDLPDDAESTDHLPPSHVKTLIAATEEMEPAFTKIITRLRPKFLIADFTPLFLPIVASRLKIPVLYYATMGAYSLSIIHSIISTLPLPQGEATTVVLPGLPKPTTLRDSDILPPYRGASKTDSIYFLATVFRNLRNCCGIVMNTAYEMEAEFVAHIQRTFGVPVWTVGPVISPSLFNHRQDSVSRDGYDALRLWLDSRKRRSVVYVNFGSEIALSAEQTREVAAGLEASGHCFLWALKKPVEEAAEEDFVGSLLPPGFREKINDKGIVVSGWVPQEGILSHGATGAFMSHCGWNSTLESLSQGVPLLAWPFQHDQPFVKKLLVEEMGVAEEIMREAAENGEGFVVKSGEVERGVKVVMGGEKGEEMRRRAAELQASAIRAGREGGSSFTNLEKLASFMTSFQSQ